MGEPDDTGEELARLLMATRLAESRGRASFELGDYRSATQLLASAVARSPGADDLRLLLNRSVKKQVRRWHFRMMNDRTRNDAYLAAVEAAVRPGDVVLDIGTGAGITAMMCARAGAAHVYSCERDPLLAALAEQIIERNDLSDRVTVLPCSSREVRPGVELPVPADVVVSEIFDCGLLGESALGTLRDAADRLLRPGGAMVPGSAAVHGQLVESEALHQLNHVHDVAGFDVSSFNLVESYEYFASYLRWYPHRLLSEPFPVFDFRFGDEPGPDGRALRVPVVRSGGCHAVVMWFVLDLGNGIGLSSGPWDPDTHWRQAVQTFRVPVPLTAGRPARLTAHHNIDRVRLCLEN